MKRRVISVLTALALCLGLLPGAALAAEGEVVIFCSDDDHTKVILEEGKSYRAPDGTGFSSIYILEPMEEDDTARPYIKYEDGVLTVYQGTTIAKLELYRDLTVKSGTEYDNSLNIMLNNLDSSALVLNGHTLTTEGAKFRLGVSSSASQPVVDGGNGKIVCERGLSIISNGNGVLAAQNLTIQGGSEGVIRIEGTTDSGGIVDNVTFIGCPSVVLRQKGSATLKDLLTGVTSDTPVMIMNKDGYIAFVQDPEPDGTLWVGKTYQGNGDLSTLATVPTYFTWGRSPSEGWIYYNPGDTDSPAKLTLENWSHPNNPINCGAQATEITVKGSCAVSVIKAGAEVTVTQDGGGTLDALVDVEKDSKHTYTVYGDVGIWDQPLTNGISSDHSLEITSGATLTLPGSKTMEIDPAATITNHGTFDNMGKIELTNTGSLTLDEISQAIKGLNLSGSGTVTWDNAPDGDTYFSNNGNVRLNNLDLSAASDLEVMTQNSGYHWDAASKTLTLKNIIIDGTLTLPETGGIQIVTEGTASVKTLACCAGSPNVQLTFSGPGDLTVNDQINIAGGDGNELTVAAGAHVIAQGGISIGSGGATNSLVTVNGHLEAVGGGYALYCGKVVVSGTLDISGADGFYSNGMPKDYPGDTVDRFTGVLTVQPGGVLNVDCTGDAIKVAGPGDTAYFNEGNKDIVLSAPSGYLPSDRAVVLSGDGTSVSLAGGSFTISSANVPAPSHTHRWAEEWSGNETHHWHECTASGCTIYADSRKQGYEPHVYDDEFDDTCNVCGALREVSHKHNWSEEWSQDEEHHWHECLTPDCPITENSEKDGYGSHGDKNCPVCGHVEHKHLWASAWSGDRLYHWHECTAKDCPITENRQKDGYGMHIFDNNWDSECNVCGYWRQVSLPDSGGGDSGGDSASTYAIVIEKSVHGTVKANRVRAAGGSPVTLTVTPQEGYGLENLTVLDSRGETLRLTAQGDGKHTFTMPEGAVRVKASFVSSASSAEEECPSRAFTDLSADAWYHEAVDFVLSKGLMNGYSNGTFVPGGNLSRAMLAQILYNQAGRPAVTGASPFPDVTLDKWYGEAVIWASEQGIAGGYGDGLFHPDGRITREQLAVMLWRYAGSPKASGELPFSDAGEIGGYAREALSWAVERGVVGGYSDGRLGPKEPATRAQTARMLQKYLAE